MELFSSEATKTYLSLRDFIVRRMTLEKIASSIAVSMSAEDAVKEAVSYYKNEVVAKEVLSAVDAKKEIEQFVDYYKIPIGDFTCRTIFTRAFGAENEIQS